LSGRAECQAGGGGSGTPSRQFAQLQFGAQVSPDAHSHAAPHPQSAPHVQFSLPDAHAQAWLQVQDSLLKSFVIRVS
jgi:hypothetical protein